MPAMHPETALVPFLRGELTAEEHERVGLHLERCEQCRESIDAFASTLRTVASHLDELPAPEWSAYRRELRLKLARRAETRARWRRPAYAWASLAAAGAVAVALILSLGVRPTIRGTTPPVDQLAMEGPPDVVDVGLLRNYQMVEKLDLLEDYDVIEHLDQLPATANNHDTRS